MNKNSLHLNFYQSIIFLVKKCEFCILPAMEMLLISACLMGHPVRYDGRSLPLEPRLLAQLEEHFTLVPFCPEVEGGLSTPRPPAEIRNGKVVTCNGDDVTPAFTRGAQLTLEKMREKNIHLALLKEKSPSCGVGQIYNGFFEGKTIKGQGITAERLKKQGIQLYSELEIPRLLQNHGPERSS